MIEDLPTKKILAGGGFVGVAGLIYYLNQSGTDTDEQASGGSTETNWAQGSSGPISAGAIQGTQGGGTEGLVRNRLANENANDEYVGSKNDSKAEIVQKNKDKLPDDVIWVQQIKTDSKGKKYNPSKYHWLKQNVLPAGFTPGEDARFTVEITDIREASNSIKVLWRVTNVGGKAGEYTVEHKPPGMSDGQYGVIDNSGTLEPGETAEGDYGASKDTGDLTAKTRTADDSDSASITVSDNTSTGGSENTQPAQFAVEITDIQEGSNSIAVFWQVTNTGGKSGSYTVEHKPPGMSDSQYGVIDNSGKLAPGESDEGDYSASKNTGNLVAKARTADDSDSASITVSDNTSADGSDEYVGDNNPQPAQFAVEITDIRVSGNSIKVLWRVTNTGGESGSYTVQHKPPGLPGSTMGVIDNSGTLAPGESDTGDYGASKATGNLTARSQTADDTTSASITV